MPHLSVVFRLDPSPQQSAQLMSFASACRTIWNIALEQRQTAWRRCRKSVTWTQQCREIKDLRAEFSFFAKVPSHTLHKTLTDLDQAYKNWWAGKASYPQWKSSKRDIPSFRIGSRDTGVLSTGRHVRIVKVGRVRSFVSRPLPGRIINATVSLRHGHWYIAFCCEVPTPAESSCGTGMVGIDLGIANTVTMTTGEMLNVPTPLAHEWRRLRRLQRSVSRRQNGSRGRIRKANQVGRWYQHHTRVRRDFIAKTVLRLTSENSLVAIEDLKLSAMTQRGRRKHGLNRELAQRSFRELRTRLEQKAAMTGTRVVAVPAHHTSQTCHRCGHVAKENRESQAEFRCMLCGFECHADVNAAINILARATAGQAESHAAGVGSQ